MNPKSIVVAGIAAVLLIAGGLMMSNKQEAALEEEAAPLSEPLFPGLSDKINDVAKVIVTNAEGSVTLAKVEDEGWVLKEKDDYPINVDNLRKGLNSLAQMEKKEKKTANPDFFEKLNLTDVTEDGSNAVELRLYDSSDNELAAVILGQSDYQSFEDPHQFVRVAGENQTWLASGNITMRTDEKGWLDVDVMKVPNTEIRAVRILHPEDREEVYGYRESPSDRNFALATLPEGREFKREGITSDFASILSNVRLDDVKPADSIDGKEIATAEIETFNGMKYNVSTIEVDGDKYFTFKASVDKDFIDQENEKRIDAAKKQTEEAEAAAKAVNEAAEEGETETPEVEVPAIEPDLIDVAELEEQAEELNNKVGKWAYKFASYIQDRLTRRNEYFLKELPDPNEESEETTMDDVTDPIGEIGRVGGGQTILDMMNQNKAEVIQPE